MGRPRTQPAANATRAILRRGYPLLLALLLLALVCLADSRPAQRAYKPGQIIKQGKYRFGISKARALTRRARAGQGRRNDDRRSDQRRPGAIGPGPIYWGATIGPHLTGEQAPWDMSAVSAFAALTKPPAIIHFFSPFADCSRSPCSFYGFPTGVMRQIRDYGAIPMLSWASQSTPAYLNQPDFQLSDTLSGRYDSYIRSFAEQARDYGHPFFLRFNWEMNGNWFAWMERANGNRPGEAIAVWRHVHDIFRQAGASNVTWVWCPNVDPDNIHQGLEQLYPGDGYVDWTCLDGYNWGTHPSRQDRWRSFVELYGSTYDRIVGDIAPTKPMMVGEIASSEYGGSKAQWHRETLAAIPASFPQIRALVWFERFDDGMDWPIGTSPSAAQAFKDGIADPVYLGNHFGAIGASPIPAP